MWILTQLDKAELLYLLNNISDYYVLQALERLAQNQEEASNHKAASAKTLWLQAKLTEQAQHRLNIMQAAIEEAEKAIQRLSLSDRIRQFVNQYKEKTQRD